MIRLYKHVSFSSLKSSSTRLGAETPGAPVAHYTVHWKAINAFLLMLVLENLSFGEVWYRYLGKDFGSMDGFPQEDIGTAG